MQIVSWPDVYLVGLLNYGLELVASTYPTDLIGVSCTK
jgi:hypothetical protein